MPSALLLARYALAVIALLPALVLAEVVPHLYGVALIASGLGLRARGTHVRMRMSASIER